MLVDTLAEAGAKRIDMNMGCPFPPQVRKGRGAGMLVHPDIISKIAEAMGEYSDSIEFSVKMRLGVDDPDEAFALVDILNSMPLRHVTVHPRTAKQQYKGNLWLEDMDTFTSKLRHPVIFNGEISTPMQIDELSQRYDGVMVGRGLLARPSLLVEYRSGFELTEKEREEAFLDLLRNTFSLLEQKLCGAAQLRDKLKPYWEYAPNSLDKRLVKQGKKFGKIIN